MHNIRVRVRVRVRSGHILRRFMASINREAVQQNSEIVKVISAYRSESHMPRGARVVVVRCVKTLTISTKIVLGLSVSRTDKSSSLSAYVDLRAKQISSQIN